MLPREGADAARRPAPAALPGLRLSLTPRTRAGLASGLAILAGIAGMAAHPPLELVPLVYLAVPLLLLALRVATAHERPVPRPAVLGALAGAFTFAPMIWWIADPAGLVGWGGLVATQTAWYAAAAALLAPLVRSRWIILVAPVLWTGMEAWRSSWPLDGFGWGVLGYAHVDGSWLLPVARTLGAAGVGFLTVLVGVLAYDLVTRSAAAVAAGRLDRQTLLRAAGPGVAALAATGLLVPAIVVAPPPETGRTLDVLAVQGNDLHAWEGTRQQEVREVAGRMLAATLAAVDEGGRPELTIWPESSIDVDPFSERGRDLAAVIDRAAAAVGGNLLVGATLDGPDPARTFLNAGLLVDADGREVDRYVKRQLVPFGEYVPLRSVLGRYPALRQIPRDGVPHDEPQALRAEGVDLAVLICFETLFPRLVRENVLAADADILVAITNDATFGLLWESDQHVAQSRMRAVETGRWTVHAALSGGSALIDPHGRVHESTGLFEIATIRADVPIVSGSTPFLRAGDVVGQATRWLALGYAAGHVGVWWRRRSAAGPLR